MVKHTFALLLAAAAVGACGEDERLTKQQLSGKLQPQVEKVRAEFGAVFETVSRAEGEVKESAPVPAAALEQVRAAVATERAAADAIAALRPPEALQSDVKALVGAARTQAAQLESMAEGSPSVAELADAMEGGDMRAAMGALAEKGVLELPQN